MKNKRKLEVASLMLVVSITIFSTHNFLGSWPKHGFESHAQNVAQFLNRDFVAPSLPVARQLQSSPFALVETNFSKIVGDVDVNFWGPRLRQDVKNARRITSTTQISVSRKKKKKKKKK